MKSTFLSTQARTLLCALEKNWKALLSISLLIVIACVALILRVHNIANSMPYPGHVDEPHLTDRAGQILRTGDFNLSYFRYPRVPLYLTVAGFTVGYVDAARHSELESTKGIGSLDFPYFTHARIVWPAKLLFTLLSVLALCFWGVVAFRLYDNIFLLFLVPFVLFLSSHYFVYSQSYLNVDIVGAFFVACTYLYLFESLKQDTVLSKAIVPGVLSGIVIESKYNLLGIVVPPLLVILFYSKEHRIRKIFLFLCSVVVTVFVLCPNILAEFNVFLDDIAQVVSHYASGHSGFEGEPGLPQLIWSAARILNDLGYATLLFAGLGVAAVFYRNWRQGAILVSFPALLLLLMSMQRARFVRNIISVFGFYAVFVGIGIVVTWWAICKLSERLPRLRDSARQRYFSATVLVLVMVGVLFPIQRPLAWATTRPDSRNAAVAWIRANLPQGSTLLIPQELAMSTEALAMDYQVVVQGFEGLSRESFYEIAIDLDNPYILLPGWGYDSRKPAGQDLANVLNSFGEEFEVLRAFSGSRVLVNNSESVPSGDPKFAIGYVKPAALDAERNKIRIELDLASLEGRKKVSADGTLFLPWNSSLQSAPLQLKKGKYEVAIVTKGTEVKGTNALFEVYLGQGNLIGQFYSQKTFQEVRIPFEVAVDGEETLKVRFTNDAATKNAAGEKTEDRNAYIKSIMIFQTE